MSRHRHRKIESSSQNASHSGFMSTRPSARRQTIHSSDAIACSGIQPSASSARTTCAPLKGPRGGFGWPKDESNPRTTLTGLWPFPPLTKSSERRA